MKKFIITFFIILPNLTYADLLEKFSLACICDKSINALKYFDCKQKVSGTQLDLLNENNSNDKNIKELMTLNNYKFVEYIGVDEIWIKN